MIFLISSAVVLLGVIAFKTDAFTNVIFDTLQAVLDGVAKYTKQ